MKAIGITCGIGSMLVGAREAGFDVVGNIEWRKYYHHRDSRDRNTFEENFPGAIFKRKLADLTPEEVERMTGADIAFGHPECGFYSNLSATAQKNRNVVEMRKDPGDIPIFIELVKQLKPRFFVQDNLPKSLIGCEIQYWAEQLPEYDLFPEWVSNWGYGNVQKWRNRFFMIGALKEEKYIFCPGEIDRTFQLVDVLKNLPRANHDEHTLDGKTSKGAGIYGPETLTWAEYQKWMLANPEGETIPYQSSTDGKWRKHIGWRKAFWYDYCPVLTGGCPIGHPKTGLPFSIRERCRIQGLPDDFIIYGTKRDEGRKWDHMKNPAVIKQTGKCMPVQFCRYVALQIANHIKGKDIEDPERPMKRIINSNGDVSKAKMWLCENNKYEDQKRVCYYCWKKVQCKKYKEIKLSK